MKTITGMIVSILTMSFVAHAEPKIHTYEHTANWSQGLSPGECGYDYGSAHELSDESVKKATAQACAIAKKECLTTEAETRSNFFECIVVSNDVISNRVIEVPNCKYTSDSTGKEYPRYLGVLEATCVVMPREIEKPAVPVKKP